MNSQEAIKVSIGWRGKVQASKSILFRQSKFFISTRLHVATLQTFLIYELQTLIEINSIFSVSTLFYKLENKKLVCLAGDNFLMKLLTRDIQTFDPISILLAYA